MEKKITHSIALNYVLANCEIPSDVAEDLGRLLASIEKKNSTGSRKPTKTQVENETIKSDILSAMALGTMYTATQVGELVGVSMNKASALLSQLVKSGVVLKDTSGKQTLFCVVE